MHHASRFDLPKPCFLSSPWTPRYHAAHVPGHSTLDVGKLQHLCEKHGRDFPDLSNPPPLRAEIAAARQRKAAAAAAAAEEAAAQAAAAAEAEKAQAALLAAAAAAAGGAEPEPAAVC